MSNISTMVPFAHSGLVSPQSTYGPPMAVLRCKVAVLGSPASGKTSLISLLKSRGSMVVKNYKLTSTVEVDVVQIKLPDHPVIVELHIFDTPGQMDFVDAIPKQLGSKMNAVMVVVDVTDASSASQFHRFLEMGRSQLQNRDRGTLGCLIANKVDLEGIRKVDEGQLRGWAMTNGLEYFEMNATQGGPTGTYKDPFMYVARTFYDLYEKRRTSLIQQFA